jgi:hypothetical protein
MLISSFCRGPTLIGEVGSLNFFSEIEAHSETSRNSSLWKNVLFQNKHYYFAIQA